MMRLILLSVGMFALIVANAQSMSFDQAASFLGMSQGNNDAMETGSFKQHKFFKLLKNPIVSEGEFFFGKESFEWKTTRPVASSILLKEGAVTTIDAKGQASRLNGGEHFAAVLVSAIRGDFEVLDGKFVIEGTTTSNQLPCVELSPIDQQMTLAVSFIRLCGKGNVSEIDIRDSKANLTRIWLSRN